MHLVITYKLFIDNNTTNKKIHVCKYLYIIIIIIIIINNNTNIININIIIH